MKNLLALNDIKEESPNGIEERIFKKKRFGKMYDDSIFLPENNL
jgi:hypothetical protein